MTYPDDKLVADEAAVLGGAAESECAVGQLAGLVVVVVDVANHILVTLDLVSTCKVRK
jgi:hypothetical protein